MKGKSALRLNDTIQDVRLAFSKIGCLTSATLILLGVGLDLAIYPERASEFFWVRLATALASLWVMLVLRGPSGKSYVQELTFVWLILPQIMIAWMIYETDGVSSIYFVGLQLALYGVGMIVPISYLESIGFGIFTVAVYFVACYLHPDGIGDGSVFTANATFTAFAAIISTGCTYFNELSRMRLFLLQEQVSQQNDKLMQANKDLVDIKGQLMQREKMAAIGTLSAGLLHELNNPVNYSLMAVSMGLSLPAAKTDPMLKESLDDAHEGLTRVQNIVTDLKTFAYQKAGDDSLRPFLLEHAVRSAMRLSGYDLKGIEVVMDLPQDTHAMGDEPAIIGVLINLLSNSAKALHAINRAQPRIDIRVFLDQDRLRVSIKDNGQGIDPEHIGRVFEPFFTTRDVGAGLGLGLSVSYGIVQRHGGTLSVDSILGEWTEFSFDLPRPTP